MTPTDLAVVLCTYNRAERLDVALHSLEQVRQPKGLNWVLIIVDNNSTDDTSRVIRRAVARSILPIHAMFMPEQGKTHALNHGVTYAQDIEAQSIAFTDDDLTFSREWVAELWHAFDEPEVMGIRGAIRSSWPTSVRMPSWYADNQQNLHSVLPRSDLGDTRQRITSPPWGGNMAYRRSVFDEIEMFNHALGPIGSTHRLGEDIEFGNRVLAKGLRIDYVPSAVAFHPVYPEQVTKRYFLHWYYEFGKYYVRVHGLVGHGHFILGVPRHYIREMGKNLLRWMFSWGSQRFYYKLESTEMWGRIVEAYRTRSAPKRRKP